MSTVIKSQQKIIKVHGEDAWYVKSDSKPNGFYRVGLTLTCECPHYQYRNVVCKHIKRVYDELVIKGKPVESEEGV